MPKENQQSERQVVVIEEVKQGTALNTLSSQEDIGGVKNAAIDYKICLDFTTFAAKYALVNDRDVVVQFFPTPEMMKIVEMPEPGPTDLPALAAFREIEQKCKQQWNEAGLQALWLTTFPQVLSRVAQEYFQASYPRLHAKYTEELKSWWMKAQGYGHLTQLDQFVDGFFEKMDGALESQEN